MVIMGKVSEDLEVAMQGTPFDYGVNASTA